MFVASRYLLGMLANMADLAPIAERSFDLLMPTGERVRFTATFGPIYKEQDSYRCPIRFEGWGDPAPDIFGYDSLQAFLLAVTLLNSMLRRFTERGGRTLFPDTNDDFPLESISVAYEKTPLS
jgi:hypothetical protein